MTKERVVNLFLLFFFIEIYLYSVILVLYSPYSAQNTKELHVHAKDLSVWLETLDELIASHVHVQVVIVVSASHEH